MELHETTSENGSCQRIVRKYLKRHIIFSNGDLLQLALKDGVKPLLKFGPAEIQFFLKLKWGPGLSLKSYS